MPARSAPRSIKTQLAALAVASSLLLAAGGWYTQHVLAQQAERDARVLSRQDTLRRHIDALQLALQRLESQLYHAALELEHDYRREVLGRLVPVEDAARLLLGDGGMPEPGADRAQLERLEQLLPELRRGIEALLQPMGDARLRYPAMPYMVERLSPDNDAFLGAALVALAEGRELLASGAEAVPVLDLLHELRFARAQQTQLFRLFVANRSGAFGQPEQAMRRAEDGVRTYRERTELLLQRLAALDRDGALGFQQSASLAVMTAAQRRYSETMETVMDIYRSDAWRNDVALLRDDIEPLLGQLWSVIGDLNRGLDAQAAGGLREAEHTSSILSRLIGLFSAFTALLLLFAAVAFEHGLRRPLVRVASAMEQAAHGRSLVQLDPPATREARQLVDTFHAMQAQIRSRQEKLEESEQRFRALVDSATDALLVFGRDGRIHDANRHAETCLGYHREELLALAFADLTAACSLGNVEGIWQQANARGITTCEGICRRKDGSTYAAEARVGLVEWQGQRLMLALVRDVHERKQLERQLRQSEKLASIGQLAAGVAHEINNPVGYVYSNLTSLRGYTATLFELLARYQRLEALLPEDHAALAELRRFKTEAELDYLAEDIPDLVAESLEGAQRVKRIVQDLKDFSRTDSGEWEMADLEACLESTLNIVHNEIKYKAELVRDYGALPPVECVPAQLNQVFMNLLVNAAQAIDGTGTITLRTIGCDRGVAVEIADTGPGIPADVLPHLFEPFFTTKPPGQGTGLGLSVSYGILEHHHGRIEVESAAGDGTLFRIWLPLRQPSREG